MEIFCVNVPEHLHSNHLEKEFRPILVQVGIHTFACRKHSRKGHATLTIPDAQKAQALLDKYPNLPRGQRRLPNQTLKILNQPVYIRKSKFELDKYLIQSLEEEENKRKKKPVPKTRSLVIQPAGPKKQRSFFIVSLSCGAFDYSGDQPVFVEYFHLQQRGKIVFGQSTLKVTLQCPPHIHQNAEYQLEFDYSTIDAPIYLGGQMTPSMTFSCHGAPRLFEQIFQRPGYGFGFPGQDVFDVLRLLEIARDGKRAEQLRKRICRLGEDHRIVVATCFTYRVVLRDATDIQQVRNLSRERYIPKMERWHDTKIFPQMTYAEQLGRFLILLSRQPFPFQIKYQLQMLVWNGVLPIVKVVGLFPYAASLSSRVGVEVATRVLQKLPRQVTFAGPEVESSEFALERLVEILTEIEDGSVLDYLDKGRPGYAHENQIAIHRVTVTPTGIFLYGPYAETKNRVLRKYSKYSDHFLRVDFAEESGDPVRYDPKANLDEIFDGRFKGVLRSGISIAGHQFEFLGFSHSSLRAQSCWFMAKFTCDNGEQLDARSIIPKLGEFRHIYSPAKYAARIGQTFSDTLTSIAVDPKIVKLAQDVERNGRVFSDGCGTISKGVLWKIRKEYALRARVKPTVFQVRFSGAKGMLSLDSSKSGEEIMLRKSMIKFDAADDWNIEICGAGTNVLPFFLNAQIIKLLEDLGVPLSSFLELQTEEIEKLRSTTQSAEQAAKFIERSHIAKSTRLPWLIRLLRSLDLSHTNDSFLRKAVEFAVIIKLRDLKYRGRIQVPKGMTLYGVMDETGYLNEGEIFCPFLSERFHREILVHKNVAITRSPALHPGDIQLVNAVDVPEDSPLRQLHNCVVFSQKGDRDLASKLSGGDLDGDIFNIIYDDRLIPRKIAQPADYKREGEIILNRPVTSEDVIDFFVAFMKQDQLGRIATTHRILADQRYEGTFHRDCLLLAELHSTAVDFSKTGKAVDLRRIPKCPRSRPDFMAPSPRIHVADSLSILEEEEDHLVESDEEERSNLRYYRSERVLGHLYRAVDEKAFLKGLQSFSKGDKADLLDDLWGYVKNETAGFIWDHYISDGEKTKEVYEDNMRDMMHQYSATPWKSSLTELEVFIGTIMGENHRQTKRQKEASKSMREDYDRLVEFTISMILDRGSNYSEPLERSVACFWVALQGRNTTHYSTDKELHSFAWIAAVACLQEIQNLHATTITLF